MRLQTWIFLILSAREVFLQVEIKFEGPQSPCPRREAQENLYIAINELLNTVSKDVTDACAIEVNHMQIINHINNALNSLKPGGSHILQSTKFSPLEKRSGSKIKSSLSSLGGPVFRSGASKHNGFPTEIRLRNTGNLRPSRYYDEFPNRELIAEEDGEFMEGESDQFDRDRDLEENSYDSNRRLTDDSSNMKYEINQESLREFGPNGPKHGIASPGSFSITNPHSKAKGSARILNYKTVNQEGRISIGERTPQHQVDPKRSYDGINTGEDFMPVLYGADERQPRLEIPRDFPHQQDSESELADMEVSEYRSMPEQLTIERPTKREVESSGRPTPSQAKQEDQSSNDTFQAEDQDIKTNLPLLRSNIVVGEPKVNVIDGKPPMSFRASEIELLTLPPKTPASKPKNCIDIQKSGLFRSAIYQIFIDDDPVTVYCDMDTDGGGWTVFQKRGNNGNQKLLFYRDWNEYKTGFGLIEKDFWLGNDKIHKLTQQGPTTLRIDIKDFEGNSAFALYDGVKMGNEQQRYVLTYDKFVAGNAGNSLANGNQFFTYDVPAPGIVEIFGHPTCAQKWQSGWWYSSNPMSLACFSAYLNGPYYTDPNNVPARDGVPIINWASFLGNHHILMETEMKLRLSNYTTTN